MYILGIDTATRVAGAAVVNEDRLISERFIHNQMTHSQNIIPMIEQVITDAGIKPGDLQGIAVTGGPGSFTGLRIGMSIAKTMSLALDIPVMDVSTLEALAWNLYLAEGLICPILDAKKKEVYTCVYRSAADGLNELVSPAALDPQDLVSLLSGYQSEQVTFLGDAVPVYGEVLKGALGPRARFGSMINSYPRAAAVAELGLRQLQKGSLQDPTFLQPVYLRKSEAEITWEEKQKQLAIDN